MALTVPERRQSPRVQIEDPMQYRQVESHDFLPGWIENISSNGALIWINEDLPVDRQIIVRVVTEGALETGEDLVATLLYKLPEQEGSQYGCGYGCRIELI